MERTILHIDMNNCYASIECQINPELRGKPVAVSGNIEERKGIILAKNQLAKEKGVKTGEAIWEAKLKCSDLITVKPHYDCYLEFSKKARKIYSEYTDLIEPFGIDECWIDITGVMRNGKLSDGKEVADEIRDRIKSELGITVSVGVSFNKIFAKLGSDYKKPDATTVISRENYKDIVWSLPCESLLYVGPATYKKLRKYYIKTIGDIANTDKRNLTTWLGKWGEYLYNYANGNDFSRVRPNDVEVPAKSVSNGTTSYRDLVNDNDVKIMIFALAESVASRLRGIDKECNVVSISIKNNMFYTYGKQKKLLSPTNDAEEIAKVAFSLYKKTYDWQTSIRSMSVCVSDLTGDGDNTQLSIFENYEKKIKHHNLWVAVDNIRKRYGYTCVKRAIVMSDKGFADFSARLNNEIHPVGFNGRT